MTDQFVVSLIEAYPEISEIWLIGSRAVGTQTPRSDWDYLVFANEKVLRSLHHLNSLNFPDIDLLVVYDGNSFEKPWCDGNRKKRGSLAEWGWRRELTTRAVYRASKFSEDGDFITVGHARRVLPADHASD